MKTLINEIEANLDLHAKKRRTIRSKVEAKYHDTFDKRAGYLGNGVYTINGNYSHDTRELFLMFVAQQEQVPFTKD